MFLCYVAKLRVLTSSNNHFARGPRLPCCAGSGCMRPNAVCVYTLQAPTRCVRLHTTCAHALAHPYAHGRIYAHICACHLGAQFHARPPTRMVVCTPGQWCN
eukprot:958730-Pleurochrysis_carterae.AAC.1